jgi:hypothetical protein
MNIVYQKTGFKREFSRFVVEGREYKMDIVLSKNGVKCAVLKISDVQNYFMHIFEEFRVIH